MSGFFERTRSKLKLSGGVLKVMRYKPTVAIFVGQVHEITVEAQAVRVTFIVGTSSIRPICTVDTEVFKHTIVVMAQRREEEVFINHTTSRLAFLGSNFVGVERSTQIVTPGTFLL